MAHLGAPVCTQGLKGLVSLGVDCQLPGMGTTFPPRGSRTRWFLGFPWTGWAPGGTLVQVTLDLAESGGGEEKGDYCFELMTSPASCQGVAVLFA